MPNSNITAEKQAAHWRAQLSSDLATEQHRRAFAEWLAANPEHKAAWDKIDSFWLALDNVSASDVDLAEIPALAHVKPKYQKPVSKRFYRPVFGLAASILVIAVISTKPFSFYFSDYRTETGQQRQIVLADGSEIFMNTQTALSVNYATQQRKIYLHAGEAYFKVVPDRQRPFIVETDMGQTRALGTAFDVKLQADETVVTVFEHAVKITTVNGKTLEKLPAGERAVFSEDDLKTEQKIDIVRAESWRKQRMVFQNRALTDVVAELERYRTGRILILGSSIKNLRLTGVFGTENTDIALRTIEQSLPVKINILTGKLVILSAK
ncbi:MAG: FecR family protein [Methylococcaceae bacterium]|nr:FecR family protein [Methylococcaceae bacterium]